MSRGKCVSLCVCVGTLLYETTFYNLFRTCPHAHHSPQNLLNFTTQELLHKDAAWPA